MEEGPDQATEAETHEDRELKALVLGFLRQGPSKHPSASRIAQAIGRSPREVIDELARLSRRGELPVPVTEVPGIEAPSPVTVRESVPATPNLVPIPPRWDRAN